MVHIFASASAVTDGLWSMQAHRQGLLVVEVARTRPVFSSLSGLNARFQKVPRHLLSGRSAHPSLTGLPSKRRTSTALASQSCFQVLERCCEDPSGGECSVGSTELRVDGPCTGRDIKGTGMHVLNSEFLANLDSSSVLAASHVVLLLALDGAKQQGRCQWQGAEKEQVSCSLLFRRELILRHSRCECCPCH